MRYEKLWQWLAFRMPRNLAYWCAIRVGAYATCGKYGNQVVPELLYHRGTAALGEGLMPVFGCGHAAQRIFMSSVKHCRGSRVVIALGRKMTAVRVIDRRFDRREQRWVYSFVAIAACLG